MPYDKGDFTQQGINGHVSAIVRLNEKRLVNIDLTSNEDDEGCTISGQVTDLLNNLVYPLAEVPGLYDYIGKDTELIMQNTETINLATDTTWSSWTPSTTASNIAASKVIFDDVSLDPAYCYTVMYYQKIYPVYDSDSVNSAMLASAQLQINVLRPAYSNVTALQSSEYNSWTNLSIGSTTATLYRNSSGVVTFVATRLGAPAYASFGASAPATLTGTSDITRLEIKAQCNSTQFSTTAAGHIIPADTNFYTQMLLFKTPLNNHNTALFYDMNIEYFKNI